MLSGTFLPITTRNRARRGVGEGWMVGGAGVAVPGPCMVGAPVAVGNVVRVARTVGAALGVGVLAATAVTLATGVSGTATPEAVADAGGPRATVGVAVPRSELTGFDEGVSSTE